ncbi:hypothetical protein H5410_025850, partial [Solanum commersonii]
MYIYTVASVASFQGQRETFTLISSKGFKLRQAKGFCAKSRVGWPLEHTMPVYRVETITKRSIQNRFNANTFDDFARWQEGEIGMQQLEFNYEDWISKLDALSIWMYDFGDQHFSSTIEQKISDIDHQIGLCIKVLKSVPQDMDYPEEEKNAFNFIYQRINWRACLKFPKEPKVSDAAKDLICRLLCDIESRLGTRGVEEIK